MCIYVCVLLSFPACELKIDNKDKKMDRKVHADRKMEGGKGGGEGGRGERVSNRVGE